MSGKSSQTILQRSTHEDVEKATLYKFYVLIDPIDGLIKYVGRTVDEKNRLRNHIYESKKNNRNKKERWIVSLLRKNTQPILKVIYSERCTIEQAVNIEKMFVNKIGKRFTLKNAPDNYLGAVLTGTPVHQYDRETGTYVATYANANQAMLHTGVKDSSIGRVCKNQNKYANKSAGGYFWSFTRYEIYPYVYSKDLKRKKVQQLKNNTVIARFNSIHEADRATGISFKKISAVCNGRQKSAGGYFWRFV